MAKSMTSTVTLCAHSLLALAFLNGNAGPTTLAGDAAAASAYGIVLLPNHDRLVVARVTGPLVSYGLRAGDQIVAVNGRRVTSERAFIARLAAGNRSAIGADILVGRNGGTFHININTRQNIAAGARAGATASAPVSQRSASASAAARGGFLNPANMVITNDGRILHKDVAARLGLEGRPLPGSAANYPGEVN